MPAQRHAAWRSQRGLSVMNDDDFKKLLLWLDPDPERAGQKYEQIRNRLVGLFRTAECHTAEDLADETIDRVARKLSQGAEVYTDNYFFGVAKHVLQEHRRMVALEAPLPNPDEITAPRQQPDNDELEHQMEAVRFECMRQCFQKLPVKERELIAAYVEGEGRTKADKERIAKLRERLAGEAGVPLATLRVQVYRLRRELDSCVARCMRKGGYHAK